MASGIAYMALADNSVILLFVGTTSEEFIPSVVFVE
jgi:hypothetical protein